MPPDYFLRFPDVLARTGLSRRTIYYRMAAGTFPQSVALGPNSVAWRESELLAWMDAPLEWRAKAPETN